MFLLLYKIDSQLRAKPECATGPMRASGHNMWLFQLTSVQTPWATHLQCWWRLHMQRARASHPPDAQDGITKQRAVVKVCQHLWHTGVLSDTADASFPKAFLRKGGYASQLYPLSGCKLLRFRHYPSHHHSPPPPLTSLSWIGLHSITPCFSSQFVLVWGQTGF